MKPPVVVVVVVSVVAVSVVVSAVVGWFVGVSFGGGGVTFGVSFGGGVTFGVSLGGGGGGGVSFGGGGGGAGREADRLRVRAAWSRHFEDVDVFLSPVSFTTAPAHDDRPFEARTIATPEGDRSYADQSWWVAHAALAGLPVR